MGGGAPKMSPGAAAIRTQYSRLAARGESMFTESTFRFDILPYSSYIGLWPAIRSALITMALRAIGEGRMGGGAPKMSRR